MAARDVFCRRLGAAYASHSAQMDPVLPELAAALAGLAPRSGAIPMVSTVTGDVIEGLPELHAAYLCRNLRETVRMDRALGRLGAIGQDVFVEVSAHPVLALPLASACADRGAVVVGSPRRDEGGLAALHRSASWHCTRRLLRSRLERDSRRRRPRIRAAPHVRIPATALLARKVEERRAGGAGYFIG